MATVSKRTAEELAAILALHAKWLSGADGSPADLSGVDLSCANLRGADLSCANLRDANLRDANLSGANLRDANLSGANLRAAGLSGVDLSCADLSAANLSAADLRDANLRDANLRDTNLRAANLRGAKNADLVLAQLEILPREGEVIAWKKCCNGVLVKLRVPPGAGRSNAPGSRKCRAECADVLLVVGPDGEPRPKGVSMHDRATVYRVGETVRPHAWGTDRFVECAGGIHFFLTREEAEAYTG